MLESLNVCYKSLRLDTEGRANSLEIGEIYAWFVYANLVADSMW
jgi:hypothetical protein